MGPALSRSKLTTIPLDQIICLDLLELSFEYLPHSDLLQQRLTCGLFLQAWVSCMNTQPRLLKVSQLGCRMIHQDPFALSSWYIPLSSGYNYNLTNVLGIQWTVETLRFQNVALERVIQKHWPNLRRLWICSYEFSKVSHTLLTGLLSLTLENCTDDKATGRLSHLTNLRKLQFVNSTMTEKTTQEIAQLTCLSTLDVSGCFLHPDAVRPLIHCHKLVTLNIARNDVGNVGARAIANLSYLTVLDMKDNEISAEGVHEIAQLSNLTKLSLAGNRIGDRGLEELAALTQLTSLNVGKCAIGEGIYTLQSLTRLTDLNIGVNNLEIGGARTLASLTTLTILDISCNNLCQDGAELIAQCLTNLIRLDISMNQIGGLGAQAVSQNLTKLMDLSLCYNQLENADGTTLTHLVKLRTLKIKKGNYLTASWIKALSKFMQRPVE